MNHWWKDAELPSWLQLVQMAFPILQLRLMLLIYFFPLCAQYSGQHAASKRASGPGGMGAAPLSHSFFGVCLCFPRVTPKVFVTLAYS